MRVIKRELFGVSRADVFRLHPIGDVHLGAAACDELQFERVVSRIAEDDRGYWVGIGDYCDFINRQDRRFDLDAMADWLHGERDVAGAQAARFVECILDLLRSVGLPDRVDVPPDAPEDLVDRLVRNALESTAVPIKLNPRKVSEGDLREMFRGVVSGE